MNATRSTGTSLLLALLTALLSGCWLARGESSTCATSADCDPGDACYDNEGIKVCVPSDVASCLAGGGEHGACWDAHDRGAADQGPDVADLGGVDIVEEVDGGLDVAEDPTIDADVGDGGPGDVDEDVEVHDTSDDPDAADAAAEDLADTAVDGEDVVHGEDMLDVEDAVDAGADGTDADAEGGVDLPDDASSDPDVDVVPDTRDDGDATVEPPVAVADEYGLPEGATLVEPAPGVLSNDLSPGGADLTAQLESPPTHGDLTLAEDGGFTYVNDGDGATGDSFVYRASDGVRTSEPATVTLAINVAPTANDQDLTTPQDVPVLVTLVATDANDDGLDFALASGPAHGDLSAFDSAAGTVIYTPDPDSFGVDSFTFTASDGELESNVATVVVHVAGAPSFGVLEDQSILAGWTLEVSIAIADPDTEPGDLTLTAATDRPDLVPDGVSVTGTGSTRTVMLDAESDTAGVVTVTLELGDGLTTVLDDLVVHVGVTTNVDDEAVHGSLRRGLAISNGGDTITFDPFRFTATADEADRTIVLNEELLVDHDLTIEGPGESALTLSGNDAVRVLHVAEAVSLQVSNLTMADGAASWGAGVWNEGDSVFITQCTIADNTASSFGGGVASGSGVVDIAGATITGNSVTIGAGDGGGVHSTAELHLSNSTVSGNQAGASSGRGGGLSNSGVVTVSNCTVSDNSGGGIRNTGEATVTNSAITGNSASSGGGVYNSGPLIIENTTISGNYASGSTARGGAIYNTGAALTLISSTVSGNSVSGDGGGISTSSILAREVTVTNCTFSANTADGSGGAIYSTGSASQVVVRSSTIFGNRADADGDGTGSGGGLTRANGTLVIHGTIVADCTRGSGLGQLDEVSGTLDPSSSFNLIEHTASAGGLVNGINGNIVGIAWLSVLSPTLANNGGPTRTHRLLSGGAAVDALDVSSCIDAEGQSLTSDQRGFIRPRGARCDIGSFERQPTDP